MQDGTLALQYLCCYGKGVCFPLLSFVPHRLIASIGDGSVAVFLSKRPNAVGKNDSVTFLES